MISAQNTADNLDRWLVWLIDCLHLAIIGIVLWPLVFLDLEIAIPLRVSLIAILLITVHRSNCIILLIVLQLGLFFREPRNLDVMEEVNSIAYATMATMVLIYVSRYHMIRAKLAQLVVHEWRTQRKMRGPGGASVRSQLYLPSILSYILRCLSRALIFAIAAQLLVLCPPFEGSLYRIAEQPPYGGVGWSINTWLWASVLALIIGVSEWSRRSWTAQQARLYTRCVLANYFYRDWHLVFKYTAKKLRSNRTATKLVVSDHPRSKDIST